MSTVIQKCSVLCGFDTASSAITNDGEKPLCEWKCKATLLAPVLLTGFILSTYISHW